MFEIYLIRLRPKILYKAVAMSSQDNEVPNDVKFNLLGVDGWVQIDKWQTWSLLVVHDKNSATDFWHY